MGEEFRLPGGGGPHTLVNMDHEILRALREITTLTGPIPDDINRVRAEDYDYVILSDVDAGDHYESCVKQDQSTLASTHTERLPMAWKLMRYILSPSGYTDQVKDLPPEVWAQVCPYGRAGEACAQYRKIVVDHGIPLNEVLFPLLDSERVEVAWPTYDEFLAFEEDLVNDAIDYFIREGTTITFREMMKEKYSFSAGEARWAIEAAAAELRQIQGLHVEAQRTLTQVKLEEFTQSAKDNLLLQQQIQGLKAQAVVLGLGKVEPEDDVQAFVKAARNFAAKESAALPAPTE